jgi:chromosome partitioning protein
LRTITISNQKGGSGKTTTAVCLRAALAELNQRVLLLDLDPQRSASIWTGIRDDSRGLLDVFTDNVYLCHLVHNTSVSNLEVVPASPWLVSLERTLAAEVGAETLLRTSVRRLPARWDYLLIDCPPSLGLLAICALVASDSLLVPVETRVMALNGLATLLGTVARVQERLNPDLNVDGIVACRVDFRTNLSRQIVGRLRERFGELVLATMIRENVRLAEAPSFEQPITTYAPNSMGAGDYRALAVELLERHRRPVADGQTTSLARA